MYIHIYTAIAHIKSALIDIEQEQKKGYDHDLRMVDDSLHQAIDRLDDFLKQQRTSE